MGGKPNAGDREPSPPPRADAGPPWRWPGGAGTSLTSDLQREVYRRLQVLTAAMFAICALYLGFGLWAVPRFASLAPLRMPPYSHLVFVAAMVVSAGLFVLARARAFPPRQTESLGLVYEVGIAFLMAVWGTVVRAEMADPRLGGISWVCIWILFFPSVVPSTGIRTFLAALLSALMEPLLGYLYFGAARGGPFPPTLLLLWKESFLCAALAVIPARILRQMGREVGQARALGHYELVRLLGRGGMGEVWEARHRHLARRVAVKIVRPDALGPLGDEARWLTLRQFEREARATAALRSPHTVEVYDFGLSADGTFYYAMEFLDGRDLDTWVRRFGPMPPARVRHVLRQLVHSLADAHANGLVHRDVKPANIYLCRRGRDVDVVKVLDFGLVIENPGAGRAPDLVQLHETGRAGTLGFMAPEQVERGAAVDHRADVYATGRVGFWLLRGGDGTAMPEPSALEAVLARCVRPDPAGRPASMEELAALLDRCPAGDWDAAAARAWWAAHPDA